MLPEIHTPHTHQPEVSPLPAEDWFESSETLHKLRKHKKFPTIWCSGCGIGIVMGALIRAIDHIGLDSNNVALVSGIGCTARMPVYMDFNTLHTTHGRALAFATGLKLARPDMHVIVIMGDGDATAIGGNHFIHAARRNIGLTTIIVNNNIYGMTGGQVSPTTPHGARATTAPFGNMEYPMPISELAITAGATYVARSTVYHAMELDKYIKDAILKDGFSLVEAISYCHTTFGRLNKLGSAAEMLGLIKENSLSHSAYTKLTPELQAANTKYVRGVLHNIDHRVEYTRAYDNLIGGLEKGGGK